MATKHIPDEMKQQALRKRPIPENLRPWMDLVREIPLRQELPEWKIPDDLVVTRKTLRKWYNSISFLPLNVRQFIEEDPASSLERYQQIRGFLQVLRRIIANRPALRMGALLKLDDILPLRLAYLHSQHGRISFEPTPLAVAIENIEVDRIRECENINFKRVFWAGRSDQPCCSKNCANAHRVQKWRDRYLNIYKQNRIKREEEKTDRAADMKISGNASKQKAKRGR
jgi:hypothetical protein